MQRRRHKLMAAALAGAVIFAGRHALGVQAQASPTSAIADGQVFDASITVTDPPSPQSNSGFADCNQGMLSFIQQTHYQLAFSRDNGALSLTIAAIEVDWHGHVPNAKLSKTAVASDGSFANVDVTGINGAGLGFGGLSLSATRIRATAGQDGKSAQSIQIDGLAGSLEQSGGEFVLHCAFHAAASVTLDRTPPSATSEAPCTHEDGGCVLLADAAVRIWFSEPVVLDGIDRLLSARTDDGAPVQLRPAKVDLSPGYTMTVQGFWPLGKLVTLTVGAGVRDRAGNASKQPFAQSLAVVADPGSLDDADNSGFEQGDFSGYTLATLASYRQEQQPATQQRTRSVPAAQAASVVPSVKDVQPTEGQFLASFSDGSSQCAVGEIALTSTFIIPGGATALVLDDDFLPNGGASGGTSAPPLVLATLRGASDIRTASQARPGADALITSDVGTQHTGWQQLRITVDGLAGQQVVLTLHLQPTYDSGQAIFNTCVQGTVLLDNLRFE